MSNDSPRDGAPAPVPAAEHEQVKAERDQLLAEMRANPNYYPNLLRINREYAARCEAENAELRAKVAAALPHAPSPEQFLEQKAGYIAWAEQDHGRLTVEDVETLLTEFAAHAPSPPTGWQPIETAPKNDLILLCEGMNVFRGLWWKGNELNRADWTDDSFHYVHPTHWMPLPAPVADQTEDK